MSQKCIDYPWGKLESRRGRDKGKQGIIVTIFFRNLRNKNNKTTQASHRNCISKGTSGYSGPLVGTITGGHNFCLVLTLYFHPWSTNPSEVRSTAVNHFLSEHYKCWLAQYMQKVLSRKI